MSFYSPLPEPIPLKEQSWPEGTRPLLCTSTFCFQHETYVRQCIESILMQRTTFPVRVCIHDDASTDQTSKIIREYQSEYPGIIWAYFQGKNTYWLPNRLEVQAEYRSWMEAGTYIALCEGDDYWTDPLKLQKQVDVLEQNPDVYLCAHDVDIAYEGVSTPNREKFYDVPYEGNFIFNYSDYLTNHFFHTASKVYRVPADLTQYHKLLGSVQAASDILVNQWFLSMGKGYYMAEKMACKRRNPGGFTSSASYRDKEFRLFNRYNLLKEAAKVAPKMMKRRSLQIVADVERQLTKMMFQKRRFGIALKYGLLAVAHHPSWFIRKITALTGSNKL